MRALSKGMLFMSMLLSLACGGTEVDAEAQLEASSQEQSVEFPPFYGYCTVDCSRCSSSSECAARGAGTCTGIPAC